MSSADPRETERAGKVEKLRTLSLQGQAKVNEIVRRHETVFGHIPTVPFDRKHKSRPVHGAVGVPDPVNEFIPLLPGLIKPVKKLKDFEQPVRLGDSQPRKCPQCGCEVAAGDERPKNRSRGGIGVEQEDQEVPCSQR